MTFTAPRLGSGTAFKLRSTRVKRWIVCAKRAVAVGTKGTTLSLHSSCHALHSYSIGCYSTQWRRTYSETTVVIWVPVHPKGGCFHVKAPTLFVCAPTFYSVVSLQKPMIEQDLINFLVHKVKLEANVASNICREECVCVVASSKVNEWIVGGILFKDLTDVPEE